MSTVTNNSFFIAGNELLVTNAGFARNPTRLGEARFPSPHERNALAPRYSRGVSNSRL